MAAELSYEQLVEENRRLKAELARAREGCSAPTSSGKAAEDDGASRSLSVADAAKLAALPRRSSLTRAETARYSRHMLMPAFGRPAQEKLLSTSMLVIGAGGLGSSIIPYLAAAGVGRLCIVDDDRVEVSNLHRQVIHTTAREGMHKAVSARAAALAINPSLDCVAVCTRFTAENGMALVKSADVVLDATDNLPTRYLINDACVLAGKPLVSGAAIGFDGQVTVYNFEGGPCYRCINPKPAPSVGGCSDLGVLGPVPGLIGCYQAIEAIKVAAGIGTTMKIKLLIYDALDARCRVVRMRGRQAGCAVCGDSPTITTLGESAVVVTSTCATEVPPSDTDLGVLSVSCEEYHHVRETGDRHILLDVRKPVQFGICQLPGAHNLPLAKLESDDLSATRTTLHRLARDDAGVAGAAAGAGAGCTADEPVDTPGEASTPWWLPRYAAPCCTSIMRNSEPTFRQLLQDNKLAKRVFNVAGGLTEWAVSVDAEFPMY